MENDRKSHKDDHNRSLTSQDQNIDIVNDIGSLTKAEFENLPL